MRLVSSVSFFALLLKRCRLLCEALVAASCCFTFETSTIQKPRAFEAFQTQTSQLTLKINRKQRRKTWYLRHFRKHVTKKNKKQWKTKTPKHRIVDEYHTKHRVFKLSTKNLPKINHTPRAAADARAILLLLWVLLVVVGVLGVVGDGGDGGGSGSGGSGGEGEGGAGSSVGAIGAAVDAGVVVVMVVAAVVQDL